MSPQGLGEYYRYSCHTGYHVTKTKHNEAPANIDPSDVKLPQTLLVTGGGRGFGEAYTYAFAKAGTGDIVLAARTTTELEAVAFILWVAHPDIKVSTTKCDVTSESRRAEACRCFQSLPLLWARRPDQ